MKQQIVLECNSISTVLQDHISHWVCNKRLPLQPEHSYFGFPQSVALVNGNFNKIVAILAFLVQPPDFQNTIYKLWLGALWHSLVQITAIQSLQHGQKIFKLLKISLRLKHINLLSVPFSGFRVGILESIQKDWHSPQGSSYAAWEKKVWPT